jgi:hypothetical protein
MAESGKDAWFHFDAALSFARLKERHAKQETAEQSQQGCKRTAIAGRELLGAPSASTTWSMQGRNKPPSNTMFL